ncbi:MAG: response regulator [Patescibacteria group bacterium]
MAEAKKILIVDDDDSVRNIYVHKFKEEGFEVVPAKNGEEAWNLLEGGFLPNIVFTGILMPKMSGFDLVRKMRPDSRFTNIPIVIFSHRGREEDKEEAIWLGVNDFLVQGVVSLTETVRRINLILGEKPTYFILLDRKDEGVENLVRLLDAQQKTSLGFDKGKKLFIRIEPMKEGGEFRVGLTDGKVN